MSSFAVPVLTGSKWTIIENIMIATAIIISHNIVTVHSKYHKCNYIREISTETLLSYAL